MKKVVIRAAIGTPIARRPVSHGSQITRSLSRSLNATKCWSRLVVTTCTNNSRCSNKVWICEMPVFQKWRRRASKSGRRRSSWTGCLRKKESSKACSASFRNQKNAITSIWTRYRSPPLETTPATYPACLEAAVRFQDLIHMQTDRCRTSSRQSGKVSFVLN